MNRLRASVNVLGAKLNDGGIDVAALEAQLDALSAKGVVPKFVYTIPTAESDIIGLERRKTRCAFEDYTRSRRSGDRRRVLCRFALGRRMAGLDAGDGRF